MVNVPGEHKCRDSLTGRQDALGLCKRGRLRSLLREVFPVAPPLAFQVEVTTLLVRYDDGVFEVSLYLCVMLS